MNYSLSLFGKTNNAVVKIYLRVIVGRKPVYKYTGRQVPAKEWDPEKNKVIGNINAKVINANLGDKLNSLDKFLTNAETAGKKITPVLVKNYFKGKTSPTFYEYAKDLLDEQEKQTNKFSPETIRTYRTELNKLHEYSPNATFDDIDVKFLRKYESYLIAEGNENNTVHKAWKFLRKIFNAAIADGETDKYPFRGYDNPAYEQGDPTYLTLAEVERIEKLISKDYDFTTKYVAAHFLLGCFSGLRVSDWIQFDSKKHLIGKNRIYIRAAKNGGIVSFEVNARLKKVLGYIEGLPKLSLNKNQINKWLKVIGALAKIDKVLTTHVARHSFATRCAELGISKSICAQVLGVTEKSCSIYYRITNVAVDNEMKKFDGL